MEIINVILEKDLQERNFQPDDGMENEGSEIQAILIDLFIEATSDWDSKEYLIALRSLNEKVETFIHSAEEAQCN